MGQQRKPNIPIEDAIAILTSRPVILDCVLPVAQKNKPKRSGGKESRRDRESRRRRGNVGGKGKRRRGRRW